MRQKSGPVKEPAEKVVKDIRRATRRQFSAEEKIRIVLEGLRGEESIAELCRREGMHSRTGFSGSPVFVYRTFGSDLTLWDESFDSIEVVFDHLEIEPNRFGRPNSVSGRISGSHGRIKPRHMFKFLGIHWGHFPEEWELKDGKKLKESRTGLIVDGAYVKGLSGMTCVIPSWQIMEVLDMPKLKGPRDAVFAAVKEERAGARLSRPVAESAKRPDENPNHREDFTALLNAAVRKPQSKD